MHQILDAHSFKVIARSNVCSATDPKMQNLHLDFPSLSEAFDGKSPPSVHSVSELIDPTSIKMPRFSPDELIGLTFLCELDDGQVVRAKVIKKIHDIDAENHKNIKMLIKLGDEDVEELISYIELNDIITKMIDNGEENPNQSYTYKGIVEHVGPLNSHHKDYKGSKYNIKIQWEDGSLTWKPLSIIAKDDPITCASYAMDHNLLDTNDWKSLRKYVRCAKKFEHMLKQIKACTQKFAPTFKFGIQVPPDWVQARKLQKDKNHTKWTDTELKENNQIMEYKTFKDLGYHANPPPEYKRICVHFVYNIKHDLHYKACLVADGHLTNPGTEESYACVISLKSLQLALLIGELNGFQAKVSDISNAYLEDYTKEKVYFTAGPEFGPLEGHTLTIVKALYGLQTSGAHFHECLAEMLVEEGFKPSLADPDLWYCDVKYAYEYVCVYVDDLCFCRENPEKFFDILVNDYKYKSKGVGPIS